MLPFAEIDVFREICEGICHLLLSVPALVFYLFEENIFTHVGIWAGASGRNCVVSGIMQQFPGVPVEIEVDRFWFVEGLGESGSLLEDPSMVIVFLLLVNQANIILPVDAFSLYFAYQIILQAFYFAFIGWRHA